jgi:CBS domain-containing protein
VLDRLGRAVGVITTRDILKAEHACETPEIREHLFNSTTVLEVMTPWPTS